VNTIAGWWFGTFFPLGYIGNVIIPTDELKYFSEGLKPPDEIDFEICGTPGLEILEF